MDEEFFWELKDDNGTPYGDGTLDHLINVLKSFDEAELADEEVVITITVKRKR